jgi:hypothetical protein
MTRPCVAPKRRGSVWVSTALHGVSKKLTTASAKDIDRQDSTVHEFYFFIFFIIVFFVLLCSGLCFNTFSNFYLLFFLCRPLLLADKFVIVSDNDESLLCWCQLCLICLICGYYSFVRSLDFRIHVALSAIVRRKVAVDHSVNCCKLVFLICERSHLTQLFMILSPLVLQIITGDAFGWSAVMLYGVAISFG